MNNTVSLYATDMDIDILESIDCIVSMEGSLTVTAHILYDIVRKLPEGSEISIESQDGTASLYSNKSKFSLPILPVEDYPALSGGDFPINFSLNSEELRRLIDRTRFAISMEETRYYLNGIFFHRQEQSLIAVATDGHRLASASMNLPNGADILKGVIVPRKAISEIRKLIEDLPNETIVNVSLSETRVRVDTDKTSITSKLIDGNFPDYSRVIPEDNKNIVSMDNLSLSESVDRVSTIFSDKSRSVRLNLTNNKLTLEANSPDTGSASDELEIDYGGEDISIGFNARYLLDLTSQIGSDKINIALKDSSAPVLISMPSDEKAFFVLMPMRV